MAVIKRGRVWYTDFSIAGKRIKKSTGTTDKALAEDIAAKLEWEYRSAAVHGVETVTTFGQAVELYLNDNKEDRFLLPLFDEWEHTKLKDITPETIRRIAKKIYPKCKPATWNRQVITPAQAVINNAAELGFASPIRVKRFKIVKPRRDAGDFDWIMAFMSAAQTPREVDLAAMALFMFTTGTRVGNAVSLTWAHTDLNTGEAHFPKTKNGTAHTAEIPPIAVAAMANLDKKRKKVFGFSSRWAVPKPWKKLCERAGIKYLTPHEAGRHGFATEMLVRQGQDIATTMDLGNWKSAKLLIENYAHAEKRKQAAKDVFGTYPAHKQAKPLK